MTEVQDTALDPRLNDLVAQLRECSDLGAAGALLAWDQETGMPAKGIDGRSSALSTIAGLSHERFTRSQVRDTLAAAEGLTDLPPAEQALLRETRRDFDRATKVPGDLVRRIARAASQAQAAWVTAKEARDFQAFLPHVQSLLELKTEYAHAVGFAEVPLDALLDDHEAGATVRSIDAQFESLKSELVPLVHAVLSSGTAVDTGPLRRSFDQDTQRAFSADVARAMGFDFEAGRIDRSAHPFCIGIHRGDVRLTWRGQPDDLRPALYGIVHEAGHGLYEQGLPPDRSGTPLCEAVSLGVHESQSRLWENMVGRSRAFWTCFLPRLKERFPGVLDDVTEDAIYHAANEVTPSLIRVEADELTYNLHIILRFELERALFAGDLAARDLPGAFADGMARMIGVRPAHDGDGVLQDVHWSMGAFGYFPTYTLGNLYAADLFEAADRDLGGLDALIEKGELMPLREWLRAKIHVHGRSSTPRDLVANAIGKEPSQDAFMRYARAKFGEVYDLAL